MASTDDDKPEEPDPSRTMRLDALPEELLEGFVGKDAGYQLADEPARAVSAPPPLPPRQTNPSAGEGAGWGKKTIIVAALVTIVMAVAGVLVGTMVLGEEEAPAPPPMMELGEIEVDSN